jgi:HTH-type transcriptional regulator / antitoxin HipB
MRSLKNHLQEELKNNDFSRTFEKELRLAKLAVQIAKQREGKGLTQAELATRAHITQQQVSKVEHAGVSGFNVITLFRLCDALGLELTLSPRKENGPVTTGKRAVRSFTRKAMGSGAHKAGKSTSKRASLAS